MHKTSGDWLSWVRRRSVWVVSISVLAMGLIAGCGAPAPTATPEAAAPTPASEQTSPEAAGDTGATDEGTDEGADAAGEAALPTVTPAEETMDGTEEAGEDDAGDGAGDEADTAATTPTPSLPTFDPATVNVALREAHSGFSQPLYVTHAGDGSGRLFVVEKGGTIRIIREGETLSTPFLDITDRVGSSGSEQGLLGLAFPPNYTETGHFFVNYTDQSGNTVVARFTAESDSPDTADAASEFEILSLTQPARNHNGGMVTFGPDGYLWIGNGDGGAAGDVFGNGQNPQTLLGALLRIDVTSDPSVPYQIPPDNPWLEEGWNGQDVRDEIWAIGLRNPWRFSFDRATGDLWIGDVGQNQYEEINMTPAESEGGLNYGWPILEATHCYQSADCEAGGMVMPVVEYELNRGNCAVTGGYVYRGSQFPQLQGVYIFGDYCSGRIWAATPQADGSVTAEIVLESEVMLSSFGENEAGELFATGLSSGVIYQIVVE